MSNPAKTAIVTGAGGFLGRHLVGALLAEGYEVHGVVRHGSPLADTFSAEGLFVHELDLRDPAGAPASIPEGAQCLYHLAWNGSAPQLRNDLDAQLANIDLSLSCMRLAAERGVKRVVVPGSTNEYLRSPSAISGESCPSPGDAYGAAKVAVRYLCAQYSRARGMEFVYAILTGVYAADRHDSNVITYTIESLLRGERPALTRCEQLWDYVHVDDAVAALVAIGERGRDGAAYAVGHGDNRPLRDYIEVVHERTNPGVPLGLGDVPYDGSELPSSCVDLAALRRDTGFVPMIDFGEGIDEVIASMRANQEARGSG